MSGKRTELACSYPTCLCFCANMWIFENSTFVLLSNAYLSQGQPWPLAVNGSCPFLEKDFASENLQRPKCLTEWSASNFPGLLKPKFVAHYYKTLSLVQFVMCNRTRLDHEFFENLVETWTGIKACCLPTDARFVSFICVIPTPCRRHKAVKKCWYCRLREFKLFNEEIFGGLSQVVRRNSLLDNGCLSAGC